MASLNNLVEKGILNEENLDKLLALNNDHVLNIIDEYVELCKPNTITVITDSKEDIGYIRNRVIELGEEAKMATEGHTIHYDGFFTMSNHDQARDKVNTRVLVPKGEYASPWINTIDRDEG